MLEKQKKKLRDNARTAKHPSGPELIGHPKCGPGHIFSHQLGKCISVLAKNAKRKKKARAS